VTLFRHRWWLLQLLALCAGAVALAAACSTGGNDQTQASPGATADPPTDTATDTVSGPGDNPSGISFASEVLPVVEERCAACHTNGGAGTGHLDMGTVGDIHQARAGMELALTSGAMPPWSPTANGVALANSRALGAGESEAILAWIEAGGDLDVDKSTAVIHNTSDQPEPPEHDLTLTLPEPYVGDANLRDDYRCFVLDATFDGDTHLVGHEFIPDATQVVHHMVLYQVSGEAADEARDLSATDGRPGYSCFGGPGVQGTRGSMGAWTPGTPPTRQPADTGIRITAGNQLIMQLHYHYEAPEDYVPDQSTLHLDLSDDPAVRTLVSQALLAPVEIPCRDDQSGVLCDRGNSLRDIAESKGLRAAGLPGWLLDRCNNRSAIEVPAPPADTATVSCDRTVAAAGHIVSVGGHMHEIGSTFRIIVNPDTPDERMLLHLAEWDFNWQGRFTLQEPFAVSATDVLRVECTWDRSQRTDDEPRYILWGEGTEDEMCITSVLIDPGV
jgi:hypothetical protein